MLDVEVIAFPSVNDASSYQNRTYCELTSMNVEIIPSNYCINLAGTVFPVRHLGRVGSWMLVRNVSTWSVFPYSHNDQYFLNGGVWEERKVFSPYRSVKTGLPVVVLKALRYWLGEILLFTGEGGYITITVETEMALRSLLMVIWLLEHEYLRVSILRAKDVKGFNRYLNAILDDEILKSNGYFFVNEDTSESVKGISSLLFSLWEKYCGQSKEVKEGSPAILLAFKTVVQVLRDWELVMKEVEGTTRKPEKVYVCTSSVSAQI